MSKISYWDITRISIAFLLGMFGVWFTADLGDMPEFLAIGSFLLLTAAWIVERVFRPIEKSLHYLKDNAQMVIHKTGYVLALVLLFWGVLFLSVGVGYAGKLIFWGAVALVIGILTNPNIVHLSIRKYSITHLKL